MKATCHCLRMSRRRLSPAATPHLQRSSQRQLSILASWQGPLTTMKRRLDHRHHLPKTVSSWKGRRLRISVRPDEDFACLPAHHHQAQRLCTFPPAKILHWCRRLFPPSLATPASLQRIRQDFIHWWITPQCTRTSCLSFSPRIFPPAWRLHWLALNTLDAPGGQHPQNREIF
jgi:hypothetical protein